MNKVLSAINTSLKKAEVSRQRIAALVTPEVGRKITVLVKYDAWTEGIGSTIETVRRKGIILHVGENRVKYAYIGRVFNTDSEKWEDIQCDGYIASHLVHTDRKVYGGFFAVDDRTHA